MAKDAIVFACANPTPEIRLWEALEAGARIVATGSSDFPNQLNNSLGFPGIFRRALDVRATTMTDEMYLAAARELAPCAAERRLGTSHIIPTMSVWHICPRAAVAPAAQPRGVARRALEPQTVLNSATQQVLAAREHVHLLTEEGLIAPVRPHQVGRWLSGTSRLRQFTTR
jgi:malate dehydrogenase (oxaloacetate-decarboxylating)